MELVQQQRPMYFSHASYSTVIPLKATRPDVLYSQSFIFAGLNFCEQNGILGFWCVSVHPVDVCMPWVDQVCEYNSQIIHLMSHEILDIAVILYLNVHTHDVKYYYCSIGSH